MKRKNMSKISKNLNMILSLDKDTYAINAKNYHGTKFKKTQIILGGSLRKESNHILHLKHKDFGLSKRWPTFTITREGKIFQHYDPNFYSDFMNVKDIDKKSISVVLENMGMLYYDANKESFVNWIDEECNDDKLIGDKLWKNSRYWEKYTDAQYDSLVWICNSLIKEYEIKLDAIGHNVLETEIDLTNFQGILTKSNYDSDYTDLNPMFDWSKFLKMLNISID
jgi:hypothetical protein